jgi:hypothetical protein
MVLNSSSLQNTRATINGEKRTKIPYQIFLDEEVGLKKDPSKIRDYTRS